MASLEAALERDRSQIALRLHIARLYLDGGEAATALTHAEAVLAYQPAQTEALALARSAAEALGQAERAAGFATLLKALGEVAEGTSTPDSPTQPSAPPPAAPPTRPPAAPTTRSTEPPVEPPVEPPARPVPAELGDSATSEELDAFLDEVLSGNNDVERPRVTLADVGGLADVKKRLQTSFLGPMQSPDLRKMYGKSLRGGLLLYGPPGCGKTFLARAVAGEMGAHFFAVGLHDVLDMWLGNSEKNLHRVFETARRHAPCVLFLDEVDALGLKRSNLSHSAGRNVVVQLLSEMDSTRDDNEGVFLLGATNQPWDLDSALRRPGRFDRMLLVLPPDPPARTAILRYHLQNRPLDPRVDLERLGDSTQGYSGADLRLVCEAAAEQAMEESMATGTARPISAKDFQLALREVKPSTRPWFDMAKNYAQFANDDGLYDDLLNYMRRHRLS